MQQNSNNYYNPNGQFNGYYPPPQYNYNPIKQARQKEKHEVLTAGLALGITLIVYMIMQIVVSSVIAQPYFKEIYNSSSIFQNCVNVIGVHLFAMTIPFGIMALIMKKRFISPIIPTKKVGFSKYCAWIAIGMGGCIGANIATNYVIMLFEAGGYELSQSEMLDPDSTFACITALISTAIIPAICEEFALRCCSLGILKKHGKGFAVFATSIVFGLMHGNVIQFVFAFLVGLILAYVTVRLDNVVPAMFIHGFNNGLSVLQDTLKYYFNEDVATTALSIVWVFWIICAIVAIVVLAVKKDLLPEKGAKAQKNPASLSFGSKLLCLLPGLSVPLLILIVASATTIVKSVA